MGDLQPSECQLLTPRHIASDPDPSQCFLHPPRGTLGQEPLIQTGYLMGTCFCLKHCLWKPPFPNSPKHTFPRNCTVTTARYLERGSNVGKVRNAASNDEDLAWVCSNREVKRVRKVDLSISPESQLRGLSSEQGPSTVRRYQCRVRRSRLVSHNVYQFYQLHSLLPIPLSRGLI